MKRLLLPLLLSAALPALAEPFTLLETREPNIAALERYEVATPMVPYAGTAKAAFPQGLPLAVGSGLRFKGYEKATSALEFWSLTDRGPNVDSPDVADGKGKRASKVFAVPDYTPTITQLRVSLAEKAEVIKTLPLKQNGKPISGRPIAPGQVGASGELGLSEQLAALPYDASGLDPEGIDVDAAGNLWLVDEYGPFIVKVDGKSGEILQRYAPGQGLPAELAARQPNRGFEGVAVTPAGKVVAIVQSTLDVDGKTRNDALFTRIVELDPKTGAVRQFAYPVSAHFKKTGDMKLGDIVALSDTQFAVIEQGKDKDKRMHNDIVLLDLAAATDISGKQLADGRALEYGDAAALAAAGVQPVRKKTAIDLRALGWTAEKSEGLALVDASTLAVINDNDFGVASELRGSSLKLDELRVADGKLVDKQGQAQTGASLGVAANGESTQLWLITLQKPLKELLQ